MLNGSAGADQAGGLVTARDFGRVRVVVEGEEEFESRLTIGRLGIQHGETFALHGDLEGGELAGVLSIAVGDEPQRIAVEGIILVFGSRGDEKATQRRRRTPSSSTEMGRPRADRPRR